jgi:hypothetical protein
MVSVNLPQIKAARAKEKKMAIPPNRGILCVCNLRWLGLSYNPINLATVIMEGIAKIHIKKAVVNTRIMLSIVK